MPSKLAYEDILSQTRDFHLCKQKSHIYGLSRPSPYFSDQDSEDQVELTHLVKSFWVPGVQEAGDFLSFLYS